MDPIMNGGAAIPRIEIDTPAENLDLLRRIRKSVAYDAKAATKKLLVNVRVRKPDKTWFVRVHPSSDYRIMAYILELDREAPYLILLDALPKDIEQTVVLVELVTAIDTEGVLFLWPLRQPRGDKKRDDNEWNASARSAALTAETRWIKIVADQHAGCYNVYSPIQSLSDPNWAELPTFTQLLTVAFRDRLVESIDHPVLVQLAGEQL
jgi:hypothetical protein